MKPIKIFLSASVVFLLNYSIAYATTFKGSSQSNGGGDSGHSIIPIIEKTTLGGGDSG